LVFFHKAKKRYFKETLPGKQLGYGIALGSFVKGATPAEYLDRLSLQNEIFSDDIQLEYVLTQVRQLGSRPKIVFRGRAFAAENRVRGGFFAGTM